LLEQKVGLYHDNITLPKKRGGSQKYSVLLSRITQVFKIITLLLSLIKEGSVVEGLTIMEYFTAILTGHVPQSQLFLVPFDEDERPSARLRTKMTLCDHPQTTTTAYAAENKADDKTKEEEGESSESDDDLEKNSRNKTKI
jgi:hypothetical protein